MNRFEFVQKLKFDDQLLEEFVVIAHRCATRLRKEVEAGNYPPKAEYDSLIRTLKGVKDY